MSYIPQNIYALHCDNCGAPLKAAPLKIAVGSRSELQAQAKNKGWFLSTTRDYCPACAEKMLRASKKWQEDWD